MKRVLLLSDHSFSVHEMPDHTYEEVSERAKIMLSTNSPTSRGATENVLKASELSKSTDIVVAMIYDEVIDLRGEDDA